jgi:hypothetical protein
MAEEQEGKGFTVRDRRAFSPGGQGDASAQRASQPEETRKTQAEQPPGPPEGDVPLPEPTFSAFLTFFFFQQALLFLGDLPHPESQQAERNLPMAKYFIDTLAMLKEKTRGNLTSEEQGHLETLLAELRMRYVRAVKG